MIDLLGQFFLWFVDWLESRVAGPWRKATPSQKAGKVFVCAVTLLLIAGGVWALFHWPG